MKLQRVKNLLPDMNDPFSKFLENLAVVSLIDFLSLRHKFFILNTLNVQKEVMSIDSIFDLLFLAVFWAWQVFCDHSLLCCFVSGSY